MVSATIIFTTPTVSNLIPFNNSFTFGNIKCHKGRGLEFSTSSTPSSTPPLPQINQSNQSTTEMPRDNENPDCNSSQVAYMSMDKFIPDLEDYLKRQATQNYKTN